MKELGIVLLGNSFLVLVFVDLFLFLFYLASVLFFTLHHWQTAIISLHDVVFLVSSLGIITIGISVFFFCFGGSKLGRY